VPRLPCGHGRSNEALRFDAVAELRLDRVRPSSVVEFKLGREKAFEGVLGLDLLQRLFVRGPQLSQRFLKLNDAVGAARGQKGEQPGKCAGGNRRDRGDEDI
jgi:hypothetical protein